MEKIKIELSIWESGKIIGLLTELDGIINDKNIQQNEYVVAHSQRMKQEINLRQKSLLRKMEKSVAKHLDKR
jgi:hypothetical protein